MNGDRLAEMRRSYARSGLRRADLAGDPVEQFRRWFADAVEAGIREPNAVVVASATTAGAPSARLVLLKRYDERGFVFFTNYGSRKAAELDANPRAALLFPWHDLERQVRVEGPARRTSAAESAAYFAARPRGSQLGAWASPQSAPLPDRADLERRLAAVSDRFAADDAVPLPDFWGGYLVEPARLEFWQGREDRLHDRFGYRRAGSGWVVERLGP